MPAALLACLLASAPLFASTPGADPASRAMGQAEGLSSEMKGRVEASKADLETYLKGAEALSQRLERLGPTYVSAPDWTGAGAERDSLRRDLGDVLEKVYRERSRLDDMRKNLETREGARIISTMFAKGKRLPPRRDREERVKTAIEAVEGAPGDEVRTAFDETFTLRDLLHKSLKRVDAVNERMRADETVWGIAAQEQAKLKHIHMAFFGVCAVALAAAVWMCYKRLTAPQPDAT
jgi:hypothetical protein